MNDNPPMQQSQSNWLRPLRAVLAIAIVLLAVLIAWAIVGGGDDSDDEDTPARILSAAELSEIAADAEGPIYWAGERPGTELEYDEGVGDRVYVRYLSAGAEAGDPRPAYLTIATYPLADPAEALRANARRTNTRVLRARDGTLVWVNPARPQSVYLAEPGAEHQVEVYDPLPRQALEIALSGEVAPVG